MNLFVELQKGIRKANPKLILAALPDIRGLLEEREYRKMEKLGQKLGIPVPGMFCRRQIFLDGKETFDSGLNRSRTVNRNYYNLLFCQGACKNSDDSGNFGTSYLSFLDITNTIRGSEDLPRASATANADARDATDGILAVSGGDTIGILFGTSSAAETFEGYELGTKIVNGNGVGEFDYAQSNLHSVTNATLTLKDTLIRDGNNNSGGSITVEEAAIYYGMRAAGSTHTVMMTRDLTGGDAVGDAAQYRYTYEITLVFPS